MPEAELTRPGTRLGYRRLLGINAFWLGTGAHWQPIFVSLLPLGVKLVDPAHKELLVGRATAAGGVLALLVPIAVGRLSDRTTSHWGRRRPWMVAGTLVNVIGLLLLGVAWSPIAVVLFYLLLQASNNVAGAAYSGVIPDVVPAEERGRASGLLGTMNGVGTVIGLATVAVILGIVRDGSGEPGRSGLLLSYVAVATILGLTLWITCASTPERPLPRQPTPWVRPSPTVLVFGGALALTVVGSVILLAAPALNPAALGPLTVLAAATAVVAGRRIPQLAAFVTPFRDHDFRWTFLTRAFVQLGIFSIVPFIDFYFGDVVHSANPDFASALWLLCVIAGGIIPAVIGGALSDRLGRRKIFVYISGGLQAAVVSVLLFSLVASLPALYVLGIVYGIGYGTFYAVDWAIACDVLPGGAEHAGKDMALWHISFTLPQVIAPALLSPVLYYLNRSGGSVLGITTGHSLGYRCVFGGAALWFIIGTVLVRRIRGVR